MEETLQKIRAVHFIGIGGSGMSGLARILKKEGKKISGSDQDDTAILDSLRKEGIKVMIGHKPENVPKGIQAVIYSPAVAENNPERIEANMLGIRQYSYPQAVGLLTKEKKTISVCGTHGKTTTTAMAAAVFINAKMDPSVIVGANIRELGNSNAHSGKGKYLIVESCEYKRGFLNFSPEVIIMTNVEADHLDYYKNLEDYKKAFLQFIGKLPENGLIVANIDDPNIRIILKGEHKVKIIWFGTGKKADVRLEGKSIYIKGKRTANLDLKIPGQHNFLNATAVIAICIELGIPLKKTISALETYRGASRRFEKIGFCGNAEVIDDYGHHPTEIRVTLRAAREKFGKNARILCIFQPHQYSRTLKLLKGFASAFGDADEVIIPNIFKVRDSAEDVKKISPVKLVETIGRNHKHVSYGGGFKRTIKDVRKRAGKYDAIIVMGAGDVYKIGEALIA